MKELPLTLYPSRIKTVILLLISILFVVEGIFMINEGNNKGWLVTVCFTLGVFVSTVMLLPSSTYLRISEEGIETKSLFKNAHIIPWNNIKEFGTSYIGLNKMVTFNFNDNYTKQKFGRELANSISGFDGALPNIYGMPAFKLAQLLNEYKAQFS